jgi:methyl-accepting chemotaxis protein
MSTPSRAASALRTGSIRARLVGGFLALAALTAGVTAVAVQRMGSIHHEMGMLEHTVIEGERLLADAKVLLNHSRVDMLQHVLSDEPAEYDRIEAELRDGDARLAADLAAFEDLDVGDEIRAEAEALAAAAAVFQAKRDERVIAPSRAGDKRAAAEGATNGAQSAYLDADEAYLAARGHFSEYGEDAVARAESTYSSARTTLVLLGLVAVGLGLALGLGIAASVATPTRRMVDALTRVADGDLTVRVADGHRDELGRMADALDRTVAATHAAVVGITERAQAVAAAAEQLAAVSTELSATAEETASQSDQVAHGADEVSANVDSVAAAAEQLGASVREIAQATTGAARTARTAAGLAAETSVLVAELDASSGQVGRILGVITSIAEQTNLLALNATIEAARAGDAGRGFAVVAGEVKDLAQATGKATGEISGIVDAIRTGTARTVQAIAGIGAAISEVDGTQASIAGAVEEQSAVTDQIARSVEEAAGGARTIAGTISGIAIATRAATEGASETNRAATSLTITAAELDELVRRFRV